MTRRPTKETTAGQCYLALQREGRRTGRPTDELIQLYALEGFLDRLTKSQYAENFVLKGGVLLAALDARRPTRDIDFAARRLANDTHREVAPVSPRLVLADYAALAQRRWLAWLKKQRIESRVPAEFSTVLDLVALFADPVIASEGPLGTWNAVQRRWVPH